MRLPKRPHAKSPSARLQAAECVFWLASTRQPASDGLRHGRDARSPSVMDFLAHEARRPLEARAAVALLRVNKPLSVSMRH